MITVALHLQRAARELRTCSDSPRLDAEILLSRVLGRSRSALLAHDGDLLADPQVRDYDALLAARRRGLPVAYLTGTREFWSMDLIVTPAVLSPRPETELLVELALDVVPPDRDCAVLDLGTGSGAIALAIAAERPRARVTGTDVSPDALDVATRNAEALGMPRIAWRLGDWFDAVPGERFDLIVANPPYIAAADPALQTLRSEPMVALSPGPGGLEALDAIVAGSAGYLTEGGWLALEHGCTQAAAVAALLERRGFSGIRSHRDLAGLPRAASGFFHSPHEGRS